MIAETMRSLKVFYCYALEDVSLKDELDKHLGALKRSGQITSWHDREIQAGLEWKREIDTHLNTSDIVLLLISPDFIASDYCYGIEMQRALERHMAKAARVIPIILRPVDFEGTPISELQALPIGKKPVTSWPDRDEAFVKVVSDLRVVIRTLNPLSQGDVRTIHRQLQQDASEPIISRPAAKHMINRHEALLLFQQMLLPKSQLRILCLVGDGKLGKTYLLTNIFPSLLQQQENVSFAVLDLHNKHNPVLTVSNLLDMACVQLDAKDFEGYYTVHQAMNSHAFGEHEPIKALSSYVNGSARKRTPNAQDRDLYLTARFVHELEQRHSTRFVFLFDHVSNATKGIQTWLMETFLMRVSRLAHVQVVIAGRSLPQAHASYTMVYQQCQLQPVKDVDEYIEYCRSLNVKLTEQSIKDLAHAFDYIPGTFVDAASKFV